MCFIYTVYIYTLYIQYITGKPANLGANACVLCSEMDEHLWNGAGMGHTKFWDVQYEKIRVKYVFFVLYGRMVGEGVQGTVGGFPCALTFNPSHPPSIPCP